ncbi:glycosyl transferase [Microbacterium sp. APC 3901]|uniref:glycosyl transferase n=1 Tax=Microbacterium sp. APC 3901 TaxID=3035192 RepID=UPI0025B61BC9|nr:glycosyl transferase [Microbacterium sp. APC 3901]MDN3444511.1 glycosyl transferase [Microbacterium sp. APC 3901]
MRFVWAVVAFVLAAGLIAAGIAQRTIFMGPSTQEVSVTVEEPAPYVLLDGDVLREHPGSQTLLVRGEGDIFAAYGRTADMQAWLAVASYNHVTAGNDGELETELIPAGATTDGDGATASPAPSESPAPAETTVPSETPAEDGATTEAGRNPAGSDLWLDSFTEADALIVDKMQLPEGVSLIIAYDGSADAPDDIVISWPLDTSTPLAGPLMAAGAAMLLVGLVLYVLAIRHQRRGRGPRRKGPGPLPATEPIDVAQLPPSERAAIEGSAADAPDGSVSSAGPSKATGAGQEESEDTAPADAPDRDRKTERRATTTGRRRLLALPALAVTALLASGCSPDSWPQFGEGTPSPSPSATVIAPDNQKPPAVTEAQARRILQEVSTTLANADAAMDIALAGTRLDGPALTARTTEYALRTAVPETPVPAAIPTDDVEVVLPEATDRWPRTVLLLSKSAGDDTVPPVILTMTQQDPWSNYKVTTMAEMSADAVFPEVAAPWLGTSLVPDDSAFLSLPPSELAETFADIVDTGETSASYGLFDEISQNLAQSIRDSRQAVVQNLADNGAAETSQTAFDMIPADSAPVSMATLDSGAIVAVSLVDTESVTPTSADAVIRFGDNAQAKALTGVSESAKGVTTKYEFQLFFSVPAQGSTEQIRLLAVRQDLLSVEVIK